MGDRQYDDEKGERFQSLYLVEWYCIHLGLNDGYYTGTWQKSTLPFSTFKNTPRRHKGAGFSAIRLDFNEPQWTVRPLNGILSWPIPATPHLLWLQPNEPLRSRGTHRFSTSAAPLHTDDFIYAGPRRHDGRSIWQLEWHLLKLAVSSMLFVALSNFRVNADLPFPLQIITIHDVFFLLHFQITTANDENITIPLASCASCALLVLGEKAGGLNMADVRTDTSQCWFLSEK